MLATELTLTVIFRTLRRRPCQAPGSGCGRDVGGKYTSHTRPFHADGIPCRGAPRLPPARLGQQLPHFCCGVSPRPPCACLAHARLRPLGPGDHTLPGSALCNTPAAPDVLWSPFVTSSATRCPGSWPSTELFILEVGGDLFQAHVVTFDNLLSPIVVISSYFKAFHSNHLRHSRLIPAANFRRRRARRPSGHRPGTRDSGNHSPPGPGGCKSEPRTRARVGLVPEAPLSACGRHLLPVSSRGRPPVHVCVLLSPHKDTGQRG